ncbi:PREDICTED: OCIA domain-containing protein 1 isoform X1 [Cyprinodon variegatus]|uniref:OCIA domain-containing protein 1 isoform X1 n=1 Tax=Cyprinodon variegatus TaxID=28743 RepID=UPI0007425C9B|nr:PREDICTED: OCIA domain-containing protein 1 isoform X1 [Cyprinodon variegatus]
MSSSPPGFTEEQQRRTAQQQSPLGVDYIPTEEEKRVLRECNHESFLYRSVPFSVVSMAITQALVARGTLSPSPRFGSLPKVAFAGFCGYLAGKLSYMKTCQEKFKRLENSPLGEILRQRAGMPQHYSGGAQSELSDPNNPSFDTMFQPAESPGAASSQTRDQGFSPDSPVQMGRADDYSSPAKSYLEEDDEPRKKPILYEDLRLKNRENYEVTMIQKADTMLKAPAERDPERGKKQVKKNIYGDTWEE